MSVVHRCRPRVASGCITHNILQDSFDRVVVKDLRLARRWQRSIQRFVEVGFGVGDGAHEGEQGGYDANADDDNVDADDDERDGDVDRMAITWRRQ